MKKDKIFPFTDKLIKIKLRTITANQINDNMIFIYSVLKCKFQSIRQNVINEQIIHEKTSHVFRANNIVSYMCRQVYFDYCLFYKSYISMVKTRLEYNTSNYRELFTFTKNLLLSLLTVGSLSRINCWI